MYHHDNAPRKSPSCTPYQYSILSVQSGGRFSSTNLKIHPKNDGLPLATIPVALYNLINNVEKSYKN
jgi:hypothetical protein